MNVRILGVQKYVFEYKGENFLVEYKDGVWCGYLTSYGRKELMAVRDTMDQVVDAMVEDINTIDNALGF